MKYNTSQVQFSSESSTEPLTLSEAKEWLKVDIAITEDDNLITELIKAARIQCEGFLGISLITRTVTAVLNNSLGDIELPYGPVVTFTSLTDKNGDAILAANYTLRGVGFKWLETPCDEYLTAVYTTGYTTLPVNFKEGVKMQIAHLYEHRGDAETLSPMVMQSLKPYRRIC